MKAGRTVAESDIDLAVKVFPGQLLGVVEVAVQTILNWTPLARLTAEREAWTTLWKAWKGFLLALAPWTVDSMKWPPGETAARALLPNAPPPQKLFGRTSVTLKRMEPLLVAVPTVKTAFDQSGPAEYMWPQTLVLTGFLWGRHSTQTLGSIDALIDIVKGE